MHSFLVDVLVEEEKLLLRFHNTINKQVTREDIDNYIRQEDIIANRYKCAVWENYVIIYKVGEEYVKIYRVVNRYRNNTRIFEGE